MPEGFLVVDKPSGMTSHDVVSVVRRATGIRKVGHAGTLDPMATGVVVVAVGRVTRLIRFIQEFTKHYLATGVFGVATDSLDADGAVLEREPMGIEAGDIEAVVPRFVGLIDQVPPMVSALKVGGERLYDIARRGETIERQARPVRVESIELIDFVPGPYPEASFRIVCGKGTYVRSIVDDIARGLGGRAHLSSLRRTQVGAMTVDEAVSIENIDAFAQRMLTPAAVLTDLPAVTVGDQIAAGVSHGLKFATGPIAEIPPETPTAVLDDDGNLLAVYLRTGRQAKPEVVLA